MQSSVQHSSRTPAPRSNGHAHGLAKAANGSLSPLAKQLVECEGRVAGRSGTGFLAALEENALGISDVPKRIKIESCLILCAIFSRGTACAVDREKADTFKAEAIKLGAGTEELNELKKVKTGLASGGLPVVAPGQKATDTQVLQYLRAQPELPDMSARHIEAITHLVRKELEGGIVSTLPRAELAYLQEIDGLLNEGNLKTLVTAALQAERDAARERESQTPLAKLFARFKEISLMEGSRIEVRGTTLTVDKIRKNGALTVCPVGSTEKRTVTPMQMLSGLVLFKKKPIFEPEPEEKKAKDAKEPKTPKKKAAKEDARPAKKKTK